MDNTRNQTQRTALFEASRELLDQPSEAAVAERAVETARDVLGVPICGLFLVDGPDTRRPVAVSDAAADTLGEPRAAEADDMIREVVETGDARRHDDGRALAAVFPGEGGGYADLVVPVGDHGVLLVGSTGGVDDETAALTEILAASVETALDLLARERKLRAQQERLEAFIGNISHDLRSPLSVANAGIEVARRTDSDDSLDRVDRAHDRIHTLIDDLLTLAREGKTLNDADLEAVELSRVAANAWSAIESTGAELAVEADETVLASPSRLQQLLENLFRNSVEHGSAGGRPQPDAPVTVRVGTLDGGFFVADDGPGIDPDARDDIFELGYSTREDGTGLGLRIVRSVVEAHGWSIRVTDAVDGGARFEIIGVELAGE